MKRIYVPSPRSTKSRIRPDEDKKRIGALEKKGDDMAAKFKGFEQVASPTEAQKQEYAGLSDAQQRGLEMMKSLQEAYQTRLQARAADVESKALAEVKAAVAKVAQEKGLSVVFTSDVAIWTANDITADVIKQVNK